MSEEEVVTEEDLEQVDDMTLLNGKPFSGIFIDYHENGHKWKERQFKKGKNDGPFFNW